MPNALYQTINALDKSKINCLMTIAIFPHLFKLMLLAKFFWGLFVCLFGLLGFSLNFHTYADTQLANIILHLLISDLPCMHISYISKYYVKDLELIERERERERAQRKRGAEHLSYDNPPL